MTPSYMESVLSDYLFETGKEVHAAIYRMRFIFVSLANVKGEENPTEALRVFLTKESNSQPSSDISMSAKAIREATGKSLLTKYLCSSSVIKCQFAVVDDNSDWQQVVEENPWLLQEKLVVKPDQLIKRRGKLGLIKVNTDLSGARAWIDERMNQVVKVDRASGRLCNFIIEPFVPHKQDEEAYVCIYSHRYADTILFHHEGGVDIGDVDAKALKLDVPIDSRPSFDDIKVKLVGNLPLEKQDYVAAFISTLYDVYVDLYFTYLEINPLVLTEGRVHILDLAAKLDATADFVCKQKWGEFEFPPAFGRDAYPENVLHMRTKWLKKSKLDVLSDTICELGGASELANYGEYSGAPTEMQTYEYAKTILGLMTQEKHPKGKILLIGGGIANFTNVAATFKGIVKALLEFQTKLIDHEVSIFVRRAGPNYQEGLRVMREVGGTLGVPIHVFGPETHMTAIVGMAMGKKSLPAMPEPALTTANFLLPGGMMSAPTPSKMARTDSGNGLSSSMEYSRSSSVSSTNGISSTKLLFSQGTKAIVWGMQTRAVQGMLDFDYVCSRKECSVVAMVYPFTGDHKQKFYWGHKEILIPVYKSMADAMRKHKEADVLINFASLRSAYESTMETMEYPQVGNIFYSNYDYCNNQIKS
ncbi:ATP-citrate synthase [Nephila pilipes]|uniref:ATP citrate synthase n=1 Tax=Nephila pilipes TaxID=299642 RepID=A0A8X6MAA1_NEPPI|nr:ATP-citrate synthase [Nephila pilipes]